MSWTHGRSARLGSLFSRRNETGRPELPMLSVYRDHGVTLREGRVDNYNKPGDDLGAYRVVHSGDLVINKMKTWQGSLGISAHEGIVSPAYFVGRPLTDDDSAFLHHLLRSQPLIAEYAARSKGIRPSQWDLPWGEFRSIRVEIPSLTTQHAIAKYLDRETTRIDALIAAKRRMMTLIEERYSTLRDKNFSARPARNARLGRFIDSIGQGVSPEAEDRPANLGEWAVLKLSAVKRGRFLSVEHKALPETFPVRPDLVPRVGDLLVTRSNTPSLVGDVCAVTESVPNVMLCDLIYVLRLRQGLDPQYAAHALLTRNARFQLASAARGTSQSMVKLRGEDIRAVTLPVPHIDEQHEVITALNMERRKADQLIASLNAQLVLLKERRQALITAAVTGQLDIPEAA